MNVAVTGGTGFVGRHILRHLTDAGHQCRAWTRRAAAAVGPVQWTPGSLGDSEAARVLVADTDVLVHAALDRPGRGFRGAEGDLPSFVEKNVVGSLRLFAAAKAAGVSRTIFISTCAVHEKILDDRPLDECHPLWPTSHYGAHKAAIEAFVHSYGLGSGWPICSLRPCGVYGIAEPIEDSKWYGLVRSVARGEGVQCQGGGKVVHANDVARAVEVLMQAPDVAIVGESFNCCDRYVSDWDVAQTTKQLCGSPSEISGGTKSPKHQIVTTKLQQLGMQFGGDTLFQATIREMLEHSPR